MVRSAIALAILGASIAITMGLVNGSSGDTEEETVQAGAAVTVMAVSPGQFAPQANWTGEVVARDQMEVSAALSGDVLALAVTEGETVAEGATLLQLATREVDWDITQARTELRELELARVESIAEFETNQALLELDEELREQAERAVARERDLRGRGASTAAALEQAQGLLAQRRQSVRQREATLGQHDNNLARLAIQQERANVTLERLADARARAEPKALFEGVVDRIDVVEGQAVSAGQHLMSLYAEDSLVWRTYLPEQAPLTLQAQLGDRSVVMGRRSTRVPEGASSLRGDFPLPEGLGWTPGEIHSARVSWPELPNVQLIPSSALYAGSRIFLVDSDERLEARVVSLMGTTRVNGDEYWLADGASLPVNGRILVTRLPNALNGLAVSVAETLDPLAGE
ncbi:MAG: hypothetical protein WED11_03815 [Natronospirillum sp.]